MIAFRALELSDVEFLYQIENMEDLYVCGSNTAPFSRFALEQYVLNSSSSLYDDGQLRLVVMCGDQSVGLIDLFAYDAKHQRAEVGIVLHPSHRGHGVGAKSLRHLVTYVHRHLHLHQLYAYVSCSNQPALRAFLSAGFHRAAVLKDWVSTSDGFQDAVVFQMINP